MVTGRELFTTFLRDEPLPRPAFVPMIRGLISRVEGVPMETLMNDPTLWANSLVKTHKLFRFDGVVVGLDFTLMAEACGCGIAWWTTAPGSCLRPAASWRTRRRPGAWRTPWKPPGASLR